MLELIKQQTDDDCVPCSLAMLFRISRDEVLHKVGNLYQPGKGLAHTWRALEALGMSSNSFVGFATAKNASDYEMDVTLHLTWNRRALVSVPSLNIKNGAHMVYVEGNKVYDPSPGIKYEDWNDLRPYEVIIFDDATLSPAGKPMGREELVAIVRRELSRSTGRGCKSEWVADALIAAGAVTTKGA